MLYRVKSASTLKDSAVKMAAAHYGLSSQLVKLSAVPTWKKQFRRAFEAIENRTHAWHGVVSRPANPVTVNNLLRSGHVAPAHLRPDMQTGPRSEWKKAPHSGAYFSTDRPTNDYWRGGTGGVGVPRTNISGEIIMRRPEGYEHELLSHGPVPLQPKAFAVPSGLGTAEELNEFRKLTQQLRLRPLHPTALQYAGGVGGPSPRFRGPNAFSKLEAGFLEGLKRHKKEYAKDLLHSTRYGVSAPLMPTPTALSGPVTRR